MFRKHIGITLIQLLIAMALGGLLLTSVVDLYANIRSTYQAQIHAASLQENFRFAFDELERNVRMAGYAGCLNLENLPLRNRTHWLFSKESSLMGFDSQHLPDYLRGKIAQNTDVIVIRKSGEAATQLKEDIGAPSSHFSVIKNPRIRENSTLLIADCHHAELFEAPFSYSNTIKIPFILDSYCVRDTEVSRFEELNYFVGKTERRGNMNYPIYALYLIVNRGKKQELVQNVCALKVWYDLNNQEFTTEEMRTKKAWSKVRGIIIQLSFCEAGETIKKYTSYVALRERLP